MPPKLPTFNYARLNARRSRVYAGIMDWLGHVLDPEMFDVIVDIVRRALKLGRAYERVLRDTLLEFAGLELTEEMNDRIAIRAAGGYDSIKKGNPVTSMNSVPPKGAWMPVEIAEMRFDSVRNHKARVKMTAVILTGGLAGHIFMQVMPAKATSIFFANSLGWAKFGPRPIHSELVQMKFTGRVVKDERKGLQVDEYKCTPGQLKLNKELRTSRAEPCLKGHRYQCKTCPIGYSRCVRGTHRYTWSPRFCERCKDERAIFDPAEANTKICLSCRSQPVRAAWARERRGVT